MNVNQNQTKKNRDRKIAWNYGMLDQTELDSHNMPLTVRAVFIIDPKKTIQLILT